GDDFAVGFSAYVGSELGSGSDFELTDIALKRAHDADSFREFDQPQPVRLERLCAPVIAWRAVARYGVRPEHSPPGERNRIDGAAPTVRTEVSFAEGDFFTGTARATQQGERIEVPELSGEQPLANRNAFWLLLFGHQFSL